MTKMRIRETKETSPGISFDDACVLNACDNAIGALKKDAEFVRDKKYKDQYIEGSVKHCHLTGYFAKFRVLEEREMTDAEVDAWYLIEAVKRNYKSLDEPLGHNLGLKVFDAKKLMEGKEVIE